MDTLTNVTTHARQIAALAFVLPCIIFGGGFTLLVALAFARFARE